MSGWNLSPREERRDGFRDASRGLRGSGMYESYGSGRPTGGSYYGGGGYGRSDRPRDADGRRVRPWDDSSRRDASRGFDAPRGPRRGGADNNQRSYFNGDIGRLHLHQPDFSQFMPFERNFYEPHPAVLERRPEQVQAIRKELGITVYPMECPPPVISFEEAFPQDYIMETVRRQNFSTPTPIQSQSWPVVLSGCDMVGIAETGSGKTLAFLLPAIIHMLNQPELEPGDGPMALFMAPTRELAIQIYEECEKFGNPCCVKSGCIYGGAKRKSQQEDLRRGLHLLVATPGRLIDFMECNETNLRRVTYLVLDEADRMLDMGFEPQIRKVVSQIRPDRQTVLWSATWPKGVEQIASEFLVDPYKVTIGSEDLKANHNITQKFVMVSSYEWKLDKLVELLNAEQNNGRILIFCAKKTTVDDVTYQLRQMGFGALCIHGDKEQPEREWVLEEFKKGTSPIMLATDVAQRGLDIKDVYCVVNYDLPSTGEDYVHRIGRTGRAGAHGFSISFFTEHDAKIANSVIRVLEEAGQEIPHDLRRFAGNSFRESSHRFSGPRNGHLSGSNAVPLHGGWK